MTSTWEILGFSLDVWAAAWYSIRRGAPATWSSVRGSTLATWSAASFGESRAAELPRVVTSVRGGVVTEVMPGRGLISSLFTSSTSSGGLGHSSCASSIQPRASPCPTR